MHFESGRLYHIYNRSNEKTFLSDDNYIYFVQKVKKHIFPFCNILAWCLMPNHFHFLIQSTEESIKNVQSGNQKALQQLAKGFRIVTSSYTQAFNKKLGRKGALFAHRTTAKPLDRNKPNLGMICFQYIHQNPVNAGLVNKMKDWEYSSYRDYAGFRNGTLVNKTVAHEILNYDKESFEIQSFAILKEKDLKNIR
jgi:putative transposase